MTELRRVSDRAGKVKEASNESFQSWGKYCPAYESPEPEVLSDILTLTLPTLLLLSSNDIPPAPSYFQLLGCKFSG